MRLSELQSKDMVSLKSGKRLGRIIDAEVNDDGLIDYFIIEPKKILKSFSSTDTNITMNQIKKYGEDVILVDV